MQRAHVGGLLEEEREGDREVGRDQSLGTRVVEKREEKRQEVGRLTF